MRKMLKEPPKERHTVGAGDAIEHVNIIPPESSLSGETEEQTNQ
jgi:hypothetical protein